MNIRVTTEVLKNLGDESAISENSWQPWSSKLLTTYSIATSGHEKLEIKGKWTFELGLK